MTTAEAQTTPYALFEGHGQPVTDVDTGAVRSAIETSGAVLLRGFEPSLEGFSALSRMLCSHSSFNESPNRQLLTQGNAVQSVNLGSDPFPLHPELSREPWRPDLAMFGCINPPGVGGQTNICDGIEIVRQMPAEIRQALEGSKLYYIQPASPALLKFWLGTKTPGREQMENPPPSCPYFFRKPQGQILRGFIRPVFEPTLFQDEPAFANFVMFARDYLRLPNFPSLDGKPFPDDWLDEIRSTARRLTYSHAWQQGDILLLDNSRFMHGRKAIANAEERRIATFFGYLEGIERRPLEPENPVWRQDDFVPPDTPHDT